ncbi:MAG: cadherin-like beta sandwich domain-containing protein, partial [Bacilli bacterium]|nr:cadherin-like beta sandwich domain-containing protein [Bacilli bacterium]
MNKLKYFGLLIILLFPLKVNAKINLNCEKPNKNNVTIKCTIKSTFNIVHFEAELITDSKVTYLGSNPLSVFTNESSDKDLRFTSTSPSGGDIVAKFQVGIPNSFILGDSFSITLSNIKYKDKSSSSLKSEPNAKETIKVGTKVTNATTNKPAPPSSSKRFTVTLDNNNGTNQKQTLSCETTGSNCNIDLSSITKPTKIGNEFTGWGNTQICTSGSVSSYRAASNATLYACWKEIDESIPQMGDPVYLQSLEIEGQEIGFSKFKFEYDLTILYEIESLNIKAVPANPKTEIKINNNEELIVGENNITIILTDEEGNISTYTLNVNRLKEGEVIKDLSSDATLSNISLGTYSVDFSPTIVDYTIYIDSKTTSIPVIATATDEFAQVDVEGNTNLEDGSIIKVVVTAEDGTINTYNFHISVKDNFFKKNVYYIAGIGALVLLLIILLVINKSKKKPTKP